MNAFDLQLESAIDHVVPVYLYENNTGQIDDIKHKIKEIGNPEATKQIIDEFKPEDLEDLKRQLENDPRVKEVIGIIQQLKSEGVIGEGIVTEGFWDILSWIGNKLWDVVAWGLNSIKNTLVHLFGGKQMTSIGYVSALLLTVGLYPTLVAAGIPAGGIALGHSLTWAGIAWFGVNVLGPFLWQFEGDQSSSYQDQIGMA